MVGASLNLGMTVRLSTAFRRTLVVMTAAVDMCVCCGAIRDQILLEFFWLANC